MLILFNQITEGERVTLTLWFSRNAAHDEDQKLISFLSEGSLDNLDSNFSSLLPAPASHSMYWFPPDEASKFQSGFDIRCARLSILGLDLYSSEETYGAAVNSPKQLLKSLREPLQLAWGDELFEMKFVNILHALQVLFYFLYINPCINSFPCEPLVFLNWTWRVNLTFILMSGGTILFVEVFRTEGHWIRRSVCQTEASFCGRKGESEIPKTGGSKRSPTNRNIY